LRLAKASRAGTGNEKVKCKLLQGEDISEQRIMMGNIRSCGLFKDELETNIMKLNLSLFS